MNIRVKINDQVFDVEIADLSARPIQAVVDGETFEVWPEEAAPAAAAAVQPAARTEAAPAHPMAPAVSDNGGNKTRMVTAPIPGVIISIAVKPGDAVKPGQELCVLEAMKMKNSIKATREGKIGKIMINAGDHVRHGQPLVEFTD